VALPKRKRLEKGKSVGAQLGRAVGKAALRSIPGAGAVMGAVDVASALTGGGGGGGDKKRRRRSRSMYMRKGRVFMGFSQKEVKNALRRSYGGRRKK